MTQQDFMIYGFIVVLNLFLGIREILPRKTEIKNSDAPGQKEIIYRHGNRPLGAFFIVMSIWFMAITAFKAGWVHLPNITP